ncbi:MAG: HAD family hydrolase [Sarcina sp.]
MENIKGIVFFDVDGTLVDCWKGIEKPTEKTKEAIKKLKENGYLTMMATGRPMSFLSEGLKTLGLNGYITSNGTYIELDEKIILNEEVKKEVLDEIIDFCNKEEIDYVLEGQATSYISSKAEERVGLLVKTFSLPIENIKTDWEENFSVNKLIVIDNGKDSFKNLCEKFNEEFIFMQHPGKNSYDMYRRGYTKAYGIAELLKALDMPKEKTYAFGDGENDIEMFQLVGKGIAMGGSHEELLKHAYDVTEDVANEGIYKGLEKLSLI